MNAAVRGYDHQLLAKVRDAHTAVGLSKEQQLEAALKWTWRHAHNKRATSPDELTRTKARFYVNLARSSFRDDNHEAQFRDVMVPRYFEKRLSLENAVREKRDRDALDLREKIAFFRKQVYLSRTFPATLRAIIFERDNYTCKVCLRDRTALQSAGLHLECDHIVAWIDGGETTYDNGQTICSTCNKAKHHAKTYLGLVNRLSSS
jgi:5-methylcytosine-specific restriction endonuclease McrA